MPAASTPASASGGGAVPSTIGSGLKVYHCEMGKTGDFVSLRRYALRVLSGVDLSICTRGLGIFCTGGGRPSGFAFLSYGMVRGTVPGEN